MPVEPAWLRPDQLVEINRRAVAATSEPHRILNFPMLEMACHSPKNNFLYDGEEDVGILAGVLLLAIARAHAFIQGNKRTGYIAAETFVEYNGLTLNVPDEMSVAKVIVMVVEDKADEEVFLELFADCVEEPEG